MLLTSCRLRAARPSPLTLAISITTPGMNDVLEVLTLGRGLFAEVGNTSKVEFWRFIVSKCPSSGCLVCFSVARQ